MERGAAVAATLVHAFVGTSAPFDSDSSSYGVPNAAVANAVYRSTSARSEALLRADAMRDRQPVSRRTSRSDCAASSTVIRSARSANKVSRTRGSSIKYSSHVERLVLHVRVARASASPTKAV